LDEGLGNRERFSPEDGRGLLRDLLRLGHDLLAIRYTVETIPPIVTVGIRHATAGLILLALLIQRGDRHAEMKAAAVAAKPAPGGASSG